MDNTEVRHFITDAYKKFAVVKKNYYNRTSLSYYTSYIDIIINAKKSMNKFI